MADPTVFIVDDDPMLCENLAILLGTANLRIETHASAEDFLRDITPDSAGCLVLDVRMPGLSGPELQRELTCRDIHLPVIFLTAYMDLAVGIEAMKHGAFDFLTKPVNGALLLERVGAALALDQEQRYRERARGAFLKRLDRLTDRERQVVGLALAGWPNKDIAAHLGVSPRTVEGHRSRIVLKMGVSSLLAIAGDAAAAGVSLTTSDVQTGLSSS